MNHRWVKQRLAVTSDAWTPVVAPFDMDYVAIRCDTSALVLRTDQDDPNSEDTLAQSVQDGVTSNNVMGKPYISCPLYSRFPAGDVVCYVKSTAPTATVVVTWIL